jgi:hypothetical protein
MQLVLTAVIAKKSAHPDIKTTVLRSGRYFPDSRALPKRSCMDVTKIMKYIP